VVIGQEQERCRGSRKPSNKRYTDNEAFCAQGLDSKRRDVAIFTLPLVADSFPI
jgi:hypothetical protein